MMKNSWIIILTILVWSFVGGVEVGQRRSGPSSGTASVTEQVSDALVFGNREWIYYLAANNSTPRRLVKGNFPALSPDRQRVAYCAPMNTAGSAAGALMLFDLNTGKSSTILRSNAWCAHPRWSPDGERISFTLALSSGKRELHVITPDGTNNQKLITAGEQGAEDIFNPSWAPDGQSLYFQDMTSLVQVSTSGRVLAKMPLATIVAEKEAVTSADWFVPSNDGNVIAYTRSVPGTALFERTFGEPNTALFLYDWRSKTRKRLTPPNLLAIDPVWSHDGRSIYFAGYYDRDGRAAYPFKVYRIARDGGDLVQIATGETPGT
jgi:Tol biopolymer transport system component